MSDRPEYRPHCPDSLSCVGRWCVLGLSRYRWWLGKNGHLLVNLLISDATIYATSIQASPVALQPQPEKVLWLSAHGRPAVFPLLLRYSEESAVLARQGSRHRPTPTPQFQPMTLEVFPWLSVDGGKQLSERPTSPSQSRALRQACNWFLGKLNSWPVPVYSQSADSHAWSWQAEVSLCAGGASEALPRRTDGATYESPKTKRYAPFACRQTNVYSCSFGVSAA